MKSYIKPYKLRFPLIYCVYIVNICNIENNINDNINDNN